MDQGPMPGHEVLVAGHPEGHALGVAGGIRSIEFGVAAIARFQEG